MPAKVFSMLVAILGIAALSGCGENSRASGEESTRDEGSGDALTLEIGGSPGTEFSGTCKIGETEPEELDGQVPQSFTYDLRGEPFECEIASEGDLEVTLSHGGTRSVQRVSGGTLKLDYENGSISSSTSSSTASSSASSQVGSSSSGTTGEQPAGATDASGSVAVEPRDVSGFDEVELSGIGNLSIRQTGTESLSVEAEEDVLPKIRTEVVNNRLIIGPEPNTSIRTTEPIDYDLTVEDLQALTLSGSGNIDARDISTDMLRIDISGSGDIAASGRADAQKISISGSGTYRAEDLESDRVEIDVEGAGSAVVNVSDALDARVTGTGSVEYVGDPAVEQDVSGAGRVSKR